MKLPDSDGGDNYVIPFSSGGVKAPHVKRIGPAYPLFLKLEDLVTTGSGTDGIVSGGKPVTDEELAKGMGLHRKTVFEYRQRLVKHGYITTTRAPNGLIIRVRKSKKWSWIQARRKSQTVTSGRSQPVTGMEPIPGRDGAKWLSGWSHPVTCRSDEAGRSGDEAGRWSPTGGAPQRSLESPRTILPDRQCVVSERLAGVLVGAGQ